MQCHYFYVPSFKSTDAFHQKTKNMWQCAFLSLLAQLLPALFMIRVTFLMITICLQKKKKKLIQQIVSANLSGHQIRLNGLWGAVLILFCTIEPKYDAFVLQFMQVESCRFILGLSLIMVCLGLVLVWSWSSVPCVLVVSWSSLRPQLHHTHLCDFSICGTFWYWTVHS